MNPIKRAFMKYFRKDHTTYDYNMPVKKVYFFKGRLGLHCGVVVTSDKEHIKRMDRAHVYLMVNRDTYMVSEHEVNTWEDEESVIGDLVKYTLL